MVELVFFEVPGIIVEDFESLELELLEELKCFFFKINTYYDLKIISK